MTYLTDIERLNYYEGEFLGAVDFQAEQEYHRDMRRRHNLGQHTWGIVTGLELAQPLNGLTNSNGSEVDVYLQPGMAVDGFGREIVVLNQAQLTTSMLAGYYNPNPQTTPVLLYVWIGYQQNLLQSPSDPCTSQNVGNAYSRIQENYTLSVTQSNSPPSPNPLVVVSGTTPQPPQPTQLSMSGASAAAASHAGGMTITSSSTATVTSGSTTTTITSQSTTTSAPSNASSSPSSSSSNTLSDPPPVTVPYDDSVPYQEFSTDDSSIIWWLPVGMVYWDLHNQVFLQITSSAAPAQSPCSQPSQSSSQSAINICREYVGNVSAVTYVPGTSYKIVERDLPYPPSQPPAGSDPNLGGVQAEVAGSLQVDFLLNAQANAVIGGPYTPSQVPLSPLTILATTSSSNTQPAVNQELIQFRDASNNETWHICQNLNGNTPGLNFGEIISGKPADGVLFLANGGNVGIGTTSPSQNLSVNGGINLDQPGANSGNLDPGLTFGGTDKEGISSNQTSTGPNQLGLDFYTNGIARMSITNHGYVGIGTSSPVSALQIDTMTVLTEGVDTQGGVWSNFGQNAYFNGSWTRIAATKAGVNLHMNPQDGVGQEVRFHLIPATGSGPPGGNIAVLGSVTSYLLSTSGVGIGTQSPIASLDVGSGLLHVGGTTTPSITSQGAYLGWNALTGGTGETDFINQQGLGTGGFAFMNVTASGSGLNTLMFINGSGQAGIGTTSPSQNVSVYGGMNIDCGDNNPGGPFVWGTPNYLLTLGKASGEGIGSCRIVGNPNQWGLDFYTKGQPRMSIDNSGNVTMNGTLTVTGDVTANGYLYGNGGKSGYVVDGFVNRSGEKFEQGDVVIMHDNASSEFYGQGKLIPLVEVQLARKTGDTRVCGIVDQPEATAAAFGGLDRSKLGNAVVGLMVTLGAYAKCKVDADIMPIAAGDLLTTSSTKGHARKLDHDWHGSFGVVIGKALAPLARGKGIIPVLVSHQ
jgi:hypothetical protein